MCCYRAHSCKSCHLPSTVFQLTIIHILYCRTSLRSVTNATILLRVCVCFMFNSWMNMSGFNFDVRSSPHLAASPPGRRLETRGLPSLSVPPEIVRPRVLPSFLINSTSVTPRSSSARKHNSHTQPHTHVQENAVSMEGHVSGFILWLAALISHGWRFYNEYAKVHFTFHGSQC